MDYNKFIQENRRKIKRKHIQELLDKEEELKNKLDKMGSSFKKKWKAKIELMMEVVTCTSGKEKFFCDSEKINMITMALLYFMDPEDLIPDFIPFAGYMDDGAILNDIWAKVEIDLLKYAESKDKDLKKYI